MLGPGLGAYQGDSHECLRIKTVVFITVVWGEVVQMLECSYASG